MEIGSTSGASNQVASPDQVGFAGLKADDFMRMLITELQNQDPTQPLGNEELLGQLSAMRNLQSNIELSDTLKAFAGNNGLATASTFIGKNITGTTAQKTEITGIVDKAFVRDGKAFVAVGADEVAVDDISFVAAA